MAITFGDIREKADGVVRHPRTRKIAIWVVSIFVAIGVLLGLAAPPLIRNKLAGALSDKLHRQVSIQQIRINPYTMTVAVRGFLVKERASQLTALSFDELFVNLQLQSLFRLAPVIKELRLVKPYVNVVRNEDRTYNYQDLIEEFTSGSPAPPSTSGPAKTPPGFALHNIEIIDGKIDFDDRPEKTKHTIDQIKVGVPFISSLPADTDIKVKPEFSAVINGAPLHLGGDIIAFKDPRESSLEINIDKLEIAKYLEYSPVRLNFKIPSGELEGNIRAVFRAAKDNPSVLSISGDFGLSTFEMQQTSGTPLLKLPSFNVAIADLEIFAKKAVLKSITSQGLDLHVNRDRDGKLNLANLVEIKNDRPEEAPAGKPFSYSIDQIALESATIHLDDERPQRAYKTRFDNVNVKISGLTNEAEKKAKIELSFESEAKEKVAHTGTLQLNPLLAEGKLEIENLQPGALRSYYENALAAEIKEGLLDFSTQYSFAATGEQNEIKLTDLSANLKKFRLVLSGQPEPLWRITSLAVKDTAIDVGAKTITIGAIEGSDGNGYLQRDASGLNLARIAKAQSDATPAPPAKAKEAQWRVDLKQIALNRFRINLDDRTNSTPAKISLSDISIRGENFSTTKNQRGKATIRIRVNNKGLLRMAGTASANPVRAKFTVQAQDIDVVPFQPYLNDKVNLVLTGGRLGTKGDFTFESNAAGSATTNYQGTFDVADFGSVEKDNAQDLLKWKSLALDAVQFDLQPFQLRIGEITLADFYSRLILGPDGKMNLQKLTTPTAERQEESGAHAKETEKPTVPPADDAAPKAINIGKINLQNGNINFSDFFIKPNYTANLTGVEGAISELNPETPGEIALQARLDNSAPVDITGKINPLSKDLFLDIVADAKDIELSPMSPYSGKYVGYGIEKGKLSFNVKYKVENRKLSAQNKIILNQLTFGDKIESPTATKLPVLLAVALLKDRNGVIDVDLPISGSLDDPQFSVGGIILRVIINIITKAVTAPFSLIASAFGGGGVSGDALSYIEFDDGRANLNQAAQTKIATLVKALNDRPALNLEIIGRADPLTDLDGLKRVGIERKVKAQKFKELARKGDAPRSLDDVQVTATEYPQYLKAAYGEENFPKPRNVIGLAKDLPVPEMEKLMMQNAKVSDDEVRQLANQRAQAVRDALLAGGGINAERLFVVAGKPLTPEERSKLKGKPNRVDFATK